jgi:hypothetical protein
MAKNTKLTGADSGEERPILMGTSRNAEITVVNRPPTSRSFRDIKVNKTASVTSVKR